MSSRVAVVTGANRGIGRAIAVALAADGFDVAVTARDPATLADTVAEVEKAGGTAVALACDVRDEASVAAMADAVRRDRAGAHRRRQRREWRARRRRCTRSPSTSGATAWPPTWTGCS